MSVETINDRLEDLLDAATSPDRFGIIDPKDIEALRAAVLAAQMYAFDEGARTALSGLAESFELSGMDESARLTRRCMLQIRESVKS